MGPVRIKYYGLLPMTRRTYLKLQLLAFLLCAALMIIGLSVMVRMHILFPRLPDLKVEDDVLYQGLLSLFWVGLLILVAESIETIVMLRKFARAEAERKVQLEALTRGESASSSPTSTALPSPPNERPNTNIQP